MSFIPDTAVLIQFALASLVLAITPGPDMTLFVSRALSEGRAAGLACMFGAITGILVHTAIVALGLSALLIAAPKAFWLLKIAGAVYLVWLAWQAIRHGSAFRPDRRKRERRPLYRHWLAGLGINLLNPKIVLFFMTFLPQFVSSSDPDAAGKLFFLGVFFIVVALPVVIPIVVAADRFADLLNRNPKLMRGLDYLFAGVFATFAVKILTTQR